MGFKPSFGDVQLMGDIVRVNGQAEPGDLPDEIRVVLVQTGQTTGGAVEEMRTGWRADLGAEGFEAGEAVAIGVETRMADADKMPPENFNQFTWIQTVTIQST